MAGTGSHRYFAAFSGALREPQGRVLGLPTSPFFWKMLLNPRPSFLGTRRRDPVGGARAQDGSRHGRT